MRSNTTIKLQEGIDLMQAVILAGGMGTRMREETEFRPKPLVEIGGKPVIWHIMRNLSAQGINDFVVLTGYKGEMIRRYFLDLPALNNDFSISYSDGGIRYHTSGDESNWKVTVLDTGPDTLTAGRLAKARDFINPSTFLLTYGDGLADINLNSLLQDHSTNRLPFTLSVTSPTSRFGVLKLSSSGSVVESFLEKPVSKDKINIGFMVLDRAIFDFIEGDEPLESGPLPRIAAAGLLGAHEHVGFFHPMDTIRDQQSLEVIYTSGNAPWVNWN